MNENKMNRAKFYQLALFPMNNGATNVYFVLILSYVATFGENILGLVGFASIMVTMMRLFDAITDPIIGALMDKTNTKFGKFRIVPMVAWAATLLSRRGYELDGKKVKTIQKVNAARKEAIAKGMSMEEAMKTITDDTV